MNPKAATMLNMDEVKVDPAWALRVPPSLAVRRKVLPFTCLDGKVYVACVNPKDVTAMQAVQRHVSHPIQAEVAEAESLQRAISRIFGDGQGQMTRLALKPDALRNSRDVEHDSEDIIGLGEELLHAAILRQASDIHLDPERTGLRIRFRVDGELEEFRRLPLEIHSAVISRFKVLGKMDIAEKRAPQDGRFSHEFAPTKQMIDIRVATLPTKYGERMTLRLLALQTESLTLERLGMNQADLEIFQSAITKPYGTILLTGPTGSGKSTTLYAALRRLKEHRVANIITVEDPVEYDIEGVAQVEVDTADKIGFEKALRSILRHDPDVVMIGEIRDHTTADVAVKASLTGHLVFSTLHTNTAAGAITRLQDMRVQRFLVAATIRLMVAQRLVRQLCPHCRKPRELTEQEALLLNRPEEVGRTVYEPSGCLYCANRGYIGRLGLFELVPMTEALSRSVAQGIPETELIQELRSQKIPFLIDDGADKIFAGQTTVQDVLATVTVW